MSEGPPQPLGINYILNSEIGGVLSKGFAELYRTQPEFPISHLSKWLKLYSNAQIIRKQL